jgi:hypothetical protein
MLNLLTDKKTCRNNENNTTGMPTDSPENTSRLVRKEKWQAVCSGRLAKRKFLEVLYAILNPMET